MDENGYTIYDLTLVTSISGGKNFEVLLKFVCSNFMFFYNLLAILFFSVFRTLFQIEFFHSFHFTHFGRPGVSVVTSSGGGSGGSSSNPLERLNQLSGISMGSSSSSGGGGAATTTSRSFPAGLQISSKPLPGADNSSAQATKPSLERQGSDGEFKKTTIVLHCSALGFTTSPRHRGPKPKSNR